ncbi:MAG TPA: hypothetical protein VKH42_08005, partial [Vicinamibacterales bacterium]|nr:hypothetical protein [Vicinamibacterales bacterium]
MSIAWTIKSLSVFAVAAALARRGRNYRGSHPFPRWGPGNLTTLARAGGVSIVAGLIGEPSSPAGHGAALAFAAAVVVTLLDG